LPLSVKMTADPVAKRIPPFRSTPSTDVSYWPIASLAVMQQYTRNWGHCRQAVQLLDANTTGPAPATAGRSVWWQGSAGRPGRTMDYHPTRSVIFYRSMIAALAALK